MRSFFFLTLLTSVAFIEIFLFIQASSYINVLIIFALTVCTALIGLSIAKKQIISAFSDLKYTGDAKGAFLNHVVDGVGALGAGFLLLLPGFCTDLIGLLLLVPSLRRILLSFGFQYFLERAHTYHSHKHQTFNETDDTIIEGEFKSTPDPEDIDKTKPLI
jgi:UPF0716 family protein affecting phage T7 exclusion